MNKLAASCHDCPKANICRSSKQMLDVMKNMRAINGFAWYLGITTMMMIAETEAAIMDMTVRWG